MCTVQFHIIQYWNLSDYDQKQALRIVFFKVTEIEARRNGDSHNDTVSYEVKIGGWRCTDHTSSYKTSQKSSLRKQNLGLNTCKKVEEIKDMPRCLISQTKSILNFKKLQ